MSECKGCNEYKDSCKILSQFTYKGIMHHCPCKTCLIKGICNKDCEKYAEYVRTYYWNNNEDTSINKDIITEEYKNVDRKSSIINIHHYHRSIPVIIKYDITLHKWVLIPIIFRLDI